MREPIAIQSSFAALFDPAIASELAKRAEQWNLPRHVCRPLDRLRGKRVAKDLAAYDEEIESAVIGADEAADEPQQQCGVREIEDDEDF